MSIIILMFVYISVFGEDSLLQEMENEKLDLESVRVRPSQKCDTLTLKSCQIYKLLIFMLDRKSPVATEECI